LAADLLHLRVVEAAIRAELGDGPEVAVLAAGQRPVEHAARGLTDVAETMHRVAWNEDKAAVPHRRGLIRDRHLVGASDDEEHFLLAEMDVIWRAFAGFVPGEEDGGCPATRLITQQHFHVEAEGFDLRCLLGRYDNGAQWCGVCVQVELRDWSMN